MTKPEDYGHGLIDVSTLGSLPNRAGMCQCGEWQASGPEWQITAEHQAHASPFDPERADTRAKAVQERRRSGAAGKHRDRRSRRIRTRASARRQAVADGSLDQPN